MTISPIGFAALSLPLLMLAPGGCAGLLLDHDASTIVEMTADPTDTLRVQTDVGDVVVIGDEAATSVTARVRLVGSGLTPDAALAALGKISAERSIDPETGALVLTALHPQNDGNAQYAANWTITVPLGTALEVTTDVGDIVAENNGAPAILSTDVGDIWISGGHDLELTTDVGDIFARTSHPVTAYAEVGDVLLHHLARSDADQGVAATTDVGDITVWIMEEAMGPVSMRTDVGESSMRLPDGRVIGDDASRLLVDGQGRVSVSATADVGDTTVRMVSKPANMPVLRDRPETKSPTSDEAAGEIVVD